MPPSPTGPTVPARVRLVLTAGLMVVVALFVVTTAKVLLVLFAGVLMALWLRACAAFVARATHLRVGLVLVLLVVAALGGLVALGLVIAPRWSEELSVLDRKLPEALERLAAYWRKAPIVGPSADKAATSLQSDAKTMASAVITAAGTSVQILGGLVVLVFVTIYGAAQPHLYVHAILAVTPRPYRERMRRVLREVKTDLTRWLLWRTAAMAFVGVTTTIAFSLLGVPLSGMLGALAGLLTFIEYLGAVISAVPPVLLALANSTVTALWVLALFTALHVIEGYILTPWIVRNAVRFPPAITLGSQALMGVLLGPLGLTLSTPLLVTAVAAVKAWRAES